MLPIGVVRSCWAQKFGIPRQPGLVPAALATVELDPARVTPEALAGLDAYSHIWLIFGFHGARDVKMSVRPPRLGGRQTVGVLATRSPHRPNHLGLSAVQLVAVDAPALRLQVRGADILDGSPVFDVKPYLPYADVVPEATAPWSAPPPQAPAVRLTPAAEAFAAAHPDIAAVATQSLRLDPRRAGGHAGDYRMLLGAWDVACRVDEAGAWTILAFDPVAPTG